MHPARPRPLAAATLVVAGLLAAAAPAVAQDLSVYKNDAAKDWIAVEKENRDAAAKVLQPTVVELLDLYLDAKQSHWNLQGPEFYQLHLMYQEIADDMLKLADRVAARERQVGVPVDGRATTIAGTSDLNGYPAGELADYTTLGELGRRFYTVGTRLRTRIEAVGDADPVTQNILQDVSERIDYWTWQLRAHQVQPAPANGADAQAGTDNAGAKPGATTNQPGAGNNAAANGRATQDGGAPQGDRK